MGDFTTRFDAEILKSKMAEMEAAKAKEAKAKAEVDRVDRLLAEVAEILEHRAKFIVERFPNATPVANEDSSQVGFAFAFSETTDRKAATFSLQAKIKESRLAIIVESRMKVPCVQRVLYDYVTMPTNQPDVERARRFIEGKLFDFARDYVAM